MERRVFDIKDLPHIPELDALADVHPLIHGTPEADWDNAHFGKIEIWHGVTLDLAETLAVGTTWLNEITGGIISAQTAIKGLKLAMSLKSMNPRNPNYLFTQQVRTPEATEEVKALINIPALNEFSSTPYTLQQIVPGRQRAVQPNAINADNDAQKRFAYCFIAAYMMRLLVKAPLNAVSGIATMKIKYSSFYGPSKTVSQFNVNLQQATAYKMALLGQSHIALTFTHAIAYTHQHISVDLNQQELEVLGYLGTLPFSYTGMHAYTLIMELKNYTGLPLPKLLAMFYCNVTATGLAKIAHVFNKFERTVEHPDRNVTFRYCTIWAPHYFSSIRSKNCTHLLYTAACAWKTLNSGHPNANPENIAATKKLPDDMRRFLKETGTIIGNTLKSLMPADARAGVAGATSSSTTVGAASSNTSLSHLDPWNH